MEEPEGDAKISNSAGLTKSHKNRRQKKITKKAKKKTKFGPRTGQLAVGVRPCVCYCSTLWQCGTCDCVNERELWKRLTHTHTHTHTNESKPKTTAGLVSILFRPIIAKKNKQNKHNNNKKNAGCTCWRTKLEWKRGKKKLANCFWLKSMKAKRRAPKNGRKWP